MRPASVSDACHEHLADSTCSAFFLKIAFVRIFAAGKTSKGSPGIRSLGRWRSLTISPPDVEANGLASPIELRLQPPLLRSSLGEPERPNERNRKAASRIGTANGACPEPSHHCHGPADQWPEVRAFPCQFWRHDVLGEERTQLCPCPVEHETTVVFHVVGQALGATRPNQPVLTSLRVYRLAAQEPRDDFQKGFRNQCSDRVQISSDDFQTEALSLEGNESAATERIKERRWRLVRCPGDLRPRSLENSLVPAALPANQLLDQGKKTMTLCILGDLIREQIRTVRRVVHQRSKDDGTACWQRPGSPPVVQRGWVPGRELFVPL
ncbi:hypothetical protein HRbin30_03277 [bacterium HR30]|nr:hypothetical protein HRbin30_03277 [bacterium HR30]